MALIDPEADSRRPMEIPTMAAIGSSPSVALTRRYGRALLAPGAAILGSPDALAQPLLALLSGRDLDIITTGASSAAGAGGVGVANTFPALLTRRLGARTGVIHNFDTASQFDIRPAAEGAHHRAGAEPPGATSTTKVTGQWHLAS